MATEGPVDIGLTGLAGDEVGDPSVHGGPDKAVHFYPVEHYADWRADFAAQGHAPHALLSGPGGFGENLAATAMTEERVCIGDRFRIGTALVEISQGRQPCWKIGHHFGIPALTAAVISTGRCGYYFRVIEVGKIYAGDAVQQVEQSSHGWTVERTFRLLIGGGHKADGAVEALQELADLEALADNWRQRAVRLLA